MTVNVKEENWVGTKEAAEFLGVKPATIRDWIRKGKDSELEEWARSGRAADK